jgi:hypothetical protein
VLCVLFVKPFARDFKSKRFDDLTIISKFFSALPGTGKVELRRPGHRFVLR